MLKILIITKFLSLQQRLGLHKYDETKVTPLYGVSRSDTIWIAPYATRGSVRGM